MWLDSRNTKGKLSHETKESEDVENIEFGGNTYSVGDSFSDGYTIKRIVVQTFSKPLVMSASVMK